MADEKHNKEAMKEAIETLNQIATNHSTPKTVKKSNTDLIVELNNEEYSLSGDFHRVPSVGLKCRQLAHALRSTSAVSLSQFH